MKIQLDLDQKTIRLEDKINLGEFYKTIKKLLPNDLWKEFTLDPQTITNWTSPIIIKEYPMYPINPIPLTPVSPYPNYPYPWITCETGTNSTNIGLKTGTFNVEC